MSSQPDNKPEPARYKAPGRKVVPAADTPDNPLPPSARPKRATAAEMEQRVRTVASLLCQGQTKSFIKQVCDAKWGVGARRVEEYLRLARDLLVAEAGAPAIDLMAQSYGYYMRVIQGHEGEVEVADKLRARKYADELIGIIAPKRHELTGKDGQPLDVRMLDAAIERELAELAAKREAEAAQPGEDSQQVSGEPGTGGSEPA